MATLFQKQCLGVVAVCAGVFVWKLLSSKKKKENWALLFVKPHANNPEVVQFVKSQLGRCHIEVMKEGQLPGVEIERRSVIDNHYSAIAQYACKESPSTIPITDEKKAEFAKQFGTTWDSAMKGGKICNAIEAQAKLGNISGTELTNRWDKAKGAGKCMKISPGLYVSAVEGGVFVINGFYAAMREKYIDPRAVVYWMVVRWDADVLSWKSFRADVLGATDPAVASTSSIRNTLLRMYKEYGMTSQPNVGDNSVHASASPLEAMSERKIWLGTEYAQDPLGKRLIEAGVNEAAIAKLCSNVRVEGKNAFDIVEDMDTEEFIAWAVAHKL